MNPQLFHHIGIWLSDKELFESSFASRILHDPFLRIFWNRKYKRFLFEFEGSPILAFSADSQFLYSLSSKSPELNLWNVHDLGLCYKIVLDLKTKDNLLSFFATKDGVVIVCRDGNIYKVNMTDPSVKEFRVPAKIIWARYSLVYDWIIVLDEKHEFFYWLNLKSSSPEINLHHLNQLSHNPYDYHKVMATLSRNEKMFAFLEKNNLYVIHFDEYNSQSRHVSNGNFNWTTSISFSMNDRYLMCADDVASLEIFDPQNSEFYNRRHSTFLEYSTDFIHDETFMDYPCQDLLYNVGKNMLYKVSIENKVAIAEQKDGIKEIAFSSNRRYVVHVCESSIQVFQHTSQTITKHFTIPFKWYNDCREEIVSFSPDSQIMVIRGYYDRQIWHLESKTCICH